jgi:hypothetical protein
MACLLVCKQAFYVQSVLKNINSYWQEIKNINLLLSKNGRDCCTMDTLYNSHDELRGFD